MGTTADKLAYLVETKNLIKQAITSKGIDVADGASFREYSDLIEQIESGPNGEYDIVSEINRETSMQKLLITDAQNSYKPMIKVTAKAYFPTVKKAQVSNVITVPVITSVTGGIQE